MTPRPRKYADAPGTASSVAETRPPADDSATATVCLRSLSSAPSVEAIDRSFGMAPTILRARGAEVWREMLHDGRHVRLLEHGDVIAWHDVGLDPVARQSSPAPVDGLAGDDAVDRSEKDHAAGIRWWLVRPERKQQRVVDGL